MNKQQSDQRGIAHVVLFALLLIILGVIGFAGYRVVNKDTSTPPSTSQQSADTSTKAAVATWPTDSKITWQATGQGGWLSLPYDTQPPACPDPISLELPTPDIAKATSVLYPGQSRTGSFAGLGGTYKAHGGIRFNNNPDNNITVDMPFNGSVFRGTRFLVDGEIQYGFDIVNACGVMIRFGHLRELTPAFQAIADKFPAAIEGDSRNTKVEPQIAFKTGDKLATAVGFKATKNVGFDYGLYDLRSDNEASKDPVYKAAHADTAETSFHGLCWLNLLNAKDASIVKVLPAGDQTNGKQSDYCK